MHDDLTEFTMEDTCTKCGGEDIVLRYHGEGERHETPLWRGDEHLRMECADCGFVWGMRCKNAHTVTVALPDPEKTL